MRDMPILKKKDLTRKIDKKFLKFLINTLDITKSNYVIQYYIIFFTGSPKILLTLKLKCLINCLLHKVYRRLVPTRQLF